MWAITYYGPADAVIGGAGAFGFYTGMGLVAVLSLVVMALAVMTGLPEPEEARAVIFATDPEMRTRELPS
jgi:hypothetical protein